MTPTRASRLSVLFEEIAKIYREEAEERKPGDAKPSGRKISQLDQARARQKLKKLGIPLP